jgi:hypothetical protein
MLGLRYKEAYEGMAFKITLSADSTAPPNEIEDIKLLFSPNYATASSPSNTENKTAVAAAAQ